MVAPVTMSPSATANQSFFSRTWNNQIARGVIIGTASVIVVGTLKWVYDTYLKTWKLSDESLEEIKQAKEQVEASKFPTLLFDKLSKIRFGRLDGKKVDADSVELQQEVGGLLKLCVLTNEAIHDTNMKNMELEKKCKADGVEFKPLEYCDPFDVQRMNSLKRITEILSKKSAKK